MCHPLCLNLQMAEIALGNGLVAHIDDDDLPLVEGRKWQAHKAGGRTYAVSKVMRGGKTTVTYLQRAIWGEGREKISFRNGDSLDCRRANLKPIGLSAPQKTYARGSLGEALVIADLAKHGHDVFVPIAGHTAADLISVKGSGRPIRWQVKFRSVTKGTRSLSISLSAIHPLKGGYARKPYDLSAIDGFAICCPVPESVYYVPVSEIDPGKGSFSLCLGPQADSGRDAMKYLSPDIAGTIPDTPNE